MINKTVSLIGLLFLGGGFLGFCAETWRLESQDDWEAGLATKEGVEMKGGMVSPVGEAASITTKLKKFKTSQSAQSLLLEQSPVWENWVARENIGPANLGDAPVMLSVGENNYWMFGLYRGQRGKGGKFEAKKATLEGYEVELLTTPWPNQFNAPGGLEKSQGGYHAWQSRDMVNWVHHGPITPRFARWMTTAELVDGKAYFYYDFPNDQDPHLYIDDNLMDGKPGKNMGLAFKDPSDGSDCAFIRDLEGNFHVIYEDWSPIKASTRSWDSPLAGHARSADGISGFKMMNPVVDHRTKATGKFATYKHPHWSKEDPKNFKTSIAKYEIHEPEQPAYGDWAAISIGGQYYLFGDYDPPGGHQMSVGWFTSSTVDGPFEWCGNIGKGHPDPDIMFAEGRFYLATQQKMDFVSPGPWVETVEARVGVDTTNDGKADVFGKWQVMRESYERIPGFAKQVKRNPATLDLADLPSGFGFQVEIKLADGTENSSKPILNAMTLTFGEE